MRIFREIISKIEPLYDEKYTSLEKCCEYFKLNSNDKVFHNALFDSYMTARLICKIYETIDSHHDLYKEFDYNEKSMESHYLAYKKNKIEHYKNNNYNSNNNNIIRNNNIINNINIKENNNDIEKVEKKFYKNNNMEKKEENPEEQIPDDDTLEELLKK